MPYKAVAKMLPKYWVDCSNIVIHVLTLVVSTSKTLLPSWCR